MKQFNETLASVPDEFIERFTLEEIFYMSVGVPPSDIISGAYMDVLKNYENSVSDSNSNQ
jgi:hypothetical protein